MARYDQKMRRKENGESIVEILGIIFACLITMELIYLGAEYIMMKETSNEIKEWASEISNFFGSQKTSNDKRMVNNSYPIYPNKKIIYKTKEEVIRERSEKAYMQAQKETADFKKQYKKPSVCLNIQNKETRMFCANHFMKARKEFDSKQTLANQ